MAFAISIRAMNETAGSIRALWNEVAHFEDRPSMAELGYPPHLTLAVYAEAPAVQIRAVLREAFAGIPVVALTFARLRFFRDPLVLWAEPSNSLALATAHARIHSRIDPGLCDPHYRPGVWIPHCTLGTAIRVERLKDAIAFADRPIQAFDVLFDVADFVSFMPVAIIDEQPLS